MARPTTNQSIEDYLEAILMLQEKNGHCRSVDVANHLGFTKASIAKVMPSILKENLNAKVEDIIKAALKRL